MHPRSSRRPRWVGRAVVDEAAARLAIHDALRRRGFERDFDADGGPVYSGRLDRTNLNLPVTIEVRDLDFVTYPVVRLLPGGLPASRQLPHVLGPGRSLCYYETGSVILDRYDPAGSVVQCLERAERVLREAVRGRLDVDFADEFGAYWGRRFVYVDLPAGFRGDARLLSARLGPDGREALIVAAGSTWLDPSSRRQSDDDEPALVIDVARPLTLEPEGPWPPTTLSALNDWLRWFDPTLVGKIEATFASGRGATASVILRAPNGIYCYRLLLPRQYQTKEFLGSVRAWFRYLSEVYEPV